MKRLIFLLTSLQLGAAWSQESAQRLVRESEAQSPELELAGFHVPDGIKVQLFASEPMINKPINMAFDARGRLWVSSTVEYPYAAERERWSDATGGRVKDSRDAIKILEDTDGDGRADKVTDFADGLNIPTGVVPWHKPEHKDGCIAWSIPNIWYFADTDGDGRADLREVLFGPLGYEKDTHGMCSSFRLGLDGWIYATHGFNNSSHLQAKDGSTLDLNSGNVFRFRPDGSHVEIWSWGQVNPFGLCWDRYNNLYSADCHSNPITQLIRGAHYPSFGKPHDGLGFGPVMCQHSHGSTGLCGIVYIDGGVWGPEWDDQMLLGNCVTSKVNRDAITFSGSTPKANEGPDFITSDDPWFRPVDLQLGPDNALYIADFYNKIIGHYEVPLDHPGRDKERGRIWRVVRTANDGKPPNDFTKMTPHEIAGELGNSNLVRRHLALREVKRRGAQDWLPEFLAIFDPSENVVPQGDRRPERIDPRDDTWTDDMDTVAPSVADTRSANTLWALSYLGERLLISEVLRALHTGGIWVEDEGRGAGQFGLLMSHAVQIIGCYDQWHGWEKWNLGVVFDSRGSAAGRAATQVLLNRPDFLAGDPQWQSWVVPLLAEQLNGMLAPSEDDKQYPWNTQADQQYIHAMKLLLRDFLTQSHGLSVLAWSQSDEIYADWFKEIVLAVPTEEAARFLSLRDDFKSQVTMRHIAMYGDPECVRATIKYARAYFARTGETEAATCFAALHDGFMQRGMASPREFLAWVTELAEGALAKAGVTAATWATTSTNNSQNPYCLQERECADGRSVLVISSLNRDLKCPEKLTGILRTAPFAAPARLSFWICGHQGFPNEPANEKNMVRLVDEKGAVLQKALPPRNDVCQRIEWDLSEIQGNVVRLEIVDGDDGKSYAWLGITRIDPAVADVATFENDAARQQNLRVLAGILQHTAPVALREKLSAYLPARPAPPPLPVSAEQRQQLDALIRSRATAFAAAKPEVEKGKAIFATNCAICHQIAGEGGLIGPQLDGIKNRGVERLCEDILDPNRNVDAHFHLHVLKTKDGNTSAGFMRGEYGQAVDLVDAAGQSHRVSKGDIVEEQIVPMSVMPPTFGQSIAEKDFIDLLGWLMTQ